MTQHDPKARLRRQRERKAAKASDRATVAAYNRDGLAGITEALGAGDPAHWDTDSERGQADD